MSAELVVTVLHEADDELGYIAGFVVTDQMIVALGGISSRAPTVIASSNARDFERRETPRALGLRDVLAIADSVWACGEYGQLAVTRDHGGRWDLLATGTEGCLFGLALASDGALWVVGDGGYAARVLGDAARRVELGTTARLSAVYAVRDEVVVLGCDGVLRRWRDGVVTAVPCGATRPLTGLAITPRGTWIVVGDGGFVARSPDGQWFSRVTAGGDADLEAIAVLPEGRLVIAGDRGRILTSDDDGRSWRALPNQLGPVHLWSIERFGPGLLIGGDEGLIIKLAPPGDATWADRANVFGGSRPLDAAFAAGPANFLEHGLAAYLATHAPPRRDEPAAADATAEVAATAARDPEALRLLGAGGTPAAFADIYGVPLPAEVARLFAAVADHDPCGSFEELRLDHPLQPDVGPHNLFELMVRRNQLAPLGTDLVEAFCGVFGIGAQGNGDTYHLEIYEWDGPRQVLYLDHESATFSGVVADSLESLVYAAALVKAGEERVLSREAYAAGVRKLRGKIAPARYPSLEDQDPAFVALEPRRRDSEFFFFRARWICALLLNDGVTDIADLPGLFMPDFNQVIPQEQLPARFEACEKFIPTALYAMWRAYLFDEPELARYLELGRGHAARLVRDAAKLIDELRAGRNQLGTITDVRAHLAAFRALDLDPRRAGARKLEAEARARAAVARKDEVLAELARVPAADWAALAWQWLGDGVAHRALLERLAEPSRHGAQVAALDELRELRDDERAIALPRLAAELAPELEAVLVGSLVRDDQLAGVLRRPATVGGAVPAHDRAAGPADDDQDDVADDDADEGDDDDRAPGWEAIDAALRPIYGDTAPQHFGTVLPSMLGGNDPLHGISAYARAEPVPHWHFVTYGFTDLFHKETDDPDESGFGFELTLRLVKRPGDRQPPLWALDFLQNLARYVFGTGNRFGAGHKMGLNGPIALDRDTHISAICFADDPELDDIVSPHGRARFVQIVGITPDEYRLIQEWSTTGLLELLRDRLPFLVTDLDRASVLADPDTAALVEQRVAQEGSSEDLTFAGELQLDVDDGHVRIELGALYAAALPRAMRGRIAHGRHYELRGRGATLHLRPGTHARYLHEDGELVLELTQELAREIEARLHDCQVGSYHFDAWLEIVVTVSYIRGHDGVAIEVRGIADPDEARALLAADQARLAAEAAEDGDHGADDDDDDLDDDDLDDDDLDDDDLDDDDGDDRDDDRAGPGRARVRAALAMTERGLRLAHDDTDVQFTHAMLLLDAERAGLDGKLDELLAWLPRFAPGVRINVAARMGAQAHPRFADAVDVALRDVPPGLTERLGAPPSASLRSAALASFGDVAQELFTELGEHILARAPDRMARFVPLLPDDITLLAELAYRAIDADQRDAAIAIYDRLLALPIPADGEERVHSLRALNNACIQAHTAKAYEAAVRIADRVQPVAPEHPYLFHSAACAYAAIGDYQRALEQVKLAHEHQYDQLGQVEVDRDLGPLLEWPEFKALFRGWRDRQERS